MELLTDPLVSVITAFGSLPTGVPGFDVPPPPPPQASIASRLAIVTSPKAKERRRRRGWRQNSNAAHKSRAKVMPSGVQRPKEPGRRRGAPALGRVVVIASIEEPLPVIEAELKLQERNLPLDCFTEDTLIFEGLAEEAARAFPATANVAASLRLAIDPATPVRVRVIAVPGGNENVHEIRVQGEFGRITVKIENVPSTGNPRTSQLAAFSAIATLKNLTRSLRVGT
jgi:hypothetical protein